MHQAYEVVGYAQGSRFVVPPGATQAVFFDLEPTQNSIMFKYFSGGSLLFIGATSTSGVTFSAANLASLYAGNAFYLMGTSEVLSINGPARFYLAADGATVVGFLIRGKNE